jgi:hypothetical protein
VADAFFLGIGHKLARSHLLPQALTCYRKHVLVLWIEFKEHHGQPRVFR